MGVETGADHGDVDGVAPDGTVRRRSRAEQREDTRRRLLDAAAAAFGEHGFAGASIDDVASRAGFSRGAFYSNFDDKTDLLIQLCQRRIDGFVAAELPDIRDVASDERVASVARWLSAQEPPLELLLLMELARLRGQDAEVAGTLDRVMDTLVDSVDRLVATETAMGALPQAERRERVVAVVAGVLGADLLRHLGVHSGPRTIELLLQEVIDPQLAAERDPKLAAERDPRSAAERDADEVDS